MNKFIWIIVWLIGLLVFAGVLMWWLGSRLPREHTASVHVELDAAPNAVAARIRQVALYPSWRADVLQIEDERAENSTVRYGEKNAQGTIHYELKESLSNQEFTNLIVDKNLPFGGQWTFSIQPLGDARTQLTITEAGFVDAQLWRFFSYYWFGHERNLKLYAQNLQRSFQRPTQ
jgi:hypothetical protein